jgi:hypothetical protein
MVLIQIVKHVIYVQLVIILQHLATNDVHNVVKVHILQVKVPQRVLNVPPASIVHHLQSHQQRLHALLHHVAVLLVQVHQINVMYVHLVIGVKLDSMKVVFHVHKDDGRTYLVQY